MLMGLPFFLHKSVLNTDYCTITSSTNTTQRATKNKSKPLQQNVCVAKNYDSHALKLDKFIHRLMYFLPKTLSLISPLLF